MLVVFSPIFVAVTKIIVHNNFVAPLKANYICLANFICLVRCIHTCLYYFLILCFYFQLLFHSLLAMRQCLIRFHYNLPVILRREEILCSPLRKRKCSFNYNQPNALIFSRYKVWVIPPSLRNYFLFWSGCRSKNVFSSCSHITF